jgi:hypothetical protein
MKNQPIWAIVPTALALILSAPGVARSDDPTIEVGAILKTDPIAFQGQSGGSVSTKDCGYISSKANHLVKITQRNDYLRFSITGGGQPTLLIEGPKDRFCAIADPSSGENAEISGVWLPGTYRVYVGDRAGGQHNYTFSISSRKSS